MSVATLVLNTADILPRDTEEGIKCGQALEQTHYTCPKSLTAAPAPAEKQQARNTAYFQVLTRTNVRSIESL